jgi:osmoprotectant transport system permease protein
VTELIDWGWVVDHRGDFWALTLEHLRLTIIAVAVGFSISFPLGIFAYRHRKAYPPIAWFTGFLYTIPSLALFAALVPFTGLSVTTAEIGLVGYTLLILIRNIVGGLDSVPDDSKEAARGMGYTTRQILWRVELPMALPVIFGGLRIATVTTIGLVTVTAVIGLGGLGSLILHGLRLFFNTEIIVGSVLSMILAIAADRLLILIERRATPWVATRVKVG